MDPAKTRTVYYATVAFLPSFLRRERDRDCISELKARRVLIYYVHDKNKNRSRTPGVGACLLQKRDG